MKKLLLGVVGLVAIGIAAGVAAPAIAADLPAQTYTKAPVLIPAYYDWSGFYTGVNGGWGTSHRCFDTTVGGAVAVSDGCHDTTGGVAGGQIGYRFQSSAWVFGFEGQGDWAGLRGSSTSVAAPANTDSSRMGAFGLFTGQIGYAWNTTLLYVKGGAAVVSDQNRILTAGVLTASAPGDNRWGGTVGAGVEFSFAPNWSVAVEYDHLFVPSVTANFNTPGGAVFVTDRVRGDADLVTARINYRWGGPVIAKY